MKKIDFFYIYDYKKFVENLSCSLIKSLKHMLMNQYLT